MSDTDPELAFAALEKDAHDALLRPWESAPPVAARPLLTIASFPAFGAHRSWCLFDGDAGALALREIAWDRVSDLAAFAEPFPGRELPRPTRPTLAIRDLRLPRTKLEDLLASMEALALPDSAPLPAFSAGEVLIVRFDARPGARSYRWEHDIPDGWERLAEWTLEAREALIAAILGKA